MIVQADAFNRSKLRNVIVVALTSNLRLAQAPGNVQISSDESGLPKDSVVNISQILSMDRSRLAERVDVVPPDKVESVNRGLRLILDL
ncbi:MAG: type II toxin-antitoxin system PemK/MazF family toxin [Candidatus Bipolaricaulia bacterium]